MGDTINFDYYYGIEAEQFSFYRVPRLLIKDERFKGLSSDAKLLYGLMLDRMMLSRLVDTFFSRTSWTMLLYAENHSISVA